MPDNMWRMMRAPYRHQLSFVLLPVLFLSQVLVVQVGCVLHQGSQADCCVHHPCGTSLALPCSATDSCQSAMRIPPTVDSQTALRCIRGATVANTLLSVPSLDSDPEDSSSPSPPLSLLLRTSALRI